MEEVETFNLDFAQVFNESNPQGNVVKTKFGEIHQDDFVYNFLKDDVVVAHDGIVAEVLERTDDYLKFIAVENKAKEKLFHLDFKFMLTPQEFKTATKNYGYDPDPEEKLVDNEDLFVVKAEDLEAFSE